MQYIKVRAATHAEALSKLRAEYGSEAILFQEIQVEPKSVLSRMLGKKEWLIEAAIREKKPIKSSVNSELKSKLESLEAIIDKKKTSANNGKPTKQSLNDLIEKSISSKKNESEQVDFDKDDFLEKIRSLRPQPRAKSMEAEPIEEPSPIPAVDSASATVAVATPVIEEKKGELQQLQKDISIIKENLHSLTEKPGKEHQQREFQELHDYLMSQDFSKGYADDFIIALRSTLPENEWKLKKRIYLKARELLMSRIMVNSTLGSKRVIALVGPTGVGKTTTIAKLAAKLKLKEKMNVSLITLDNFRIAATQQLKVYGTIMDVPVTICKSPEAFKQAVDEDTADVILIDTTGISPNNREFLLTQHSFFDKLEHIIEKHLVLPATAKKQDAEQIMRQFDVLQIDKIILSKLDESSSFGAYLEISESWHKPFSFLTTGQKVPDDYVEAERKFLAEKVLENWVQGLSYDMT